MFGSGSVFSSTWPPLSTWLAGMMPFGYPAGGVFTKPPLPTEPALLKSPFLMAWVGTQDLTKPVSSRWR